VKTDKYRFLILTIGAGIGLIAAFLQTIEKLVLLQNKDAILQCNISSIFNCSTVLNASQSSLFGFPNSLICIMIFTFLMSIGLVGLSESKLTKKVLYGTQALALFMLAFALWFLFTSTYVIGAICIFCLVCFMGLLLVNGALWRLNFSGGSAKGKIRIFENFTKQGFDILLWVSLAVLVLFIIVQRFYLI